VRICSGRNDEVLVFYFLRNAEAGVPEESSLKASALPTKKKSAACFEEIRRSSNLFCWRQSSFLIISLNRSVFF
jgi:hypothetical protein